MINLVYTTLKVNKIKKKLKALFKLKKKLKNLTNAAVVGRILAHPH